MQSPDQDRGGHITSYFYDSLNRLTKTQFADGSYTQTVYNPDGTVQTSYDALRNPTNYGYDDAGRRTSLTDAMQKLTTFGYDNVGNQTSILDANQHQTQFVYDKLGRKTSTVYPDQTTDTTHYDSLGRVDYKLDQAGVRTDYGYDGDGRLTSVTQYLNFGQANQQALVTQYGYDEVGNRISQTDANQHTTKYVYDQLGRRISRTLPAGQSESYSYDAVGNLQSKIDFNGKATTYAYDSNNRMQSKTPDPSFNAPAVGFTYSATGKRLTMSDVSGVTTYTYDPQTDRLLQKQTPEGTLNYTYDAAGNLKSLQSQNQNGASDAYTYDADNRLSTVTDASGQTTYAYDNVGNLQSFAYPNGVTTAYTYNSLNRLTQMGAGKNGTLQANYVYTLGAAGNRLTVAELSGRTVNYGYDSLYRLTSEQISADPNNHKGTTGYVYDAVGNRQQLVVNGTTANTYTYDFDDRLGSDQYDPNGNTINSLAVANAYDFENHLVQHGTQPGAVAIVYDGDGNRVSETVAGVTTKYLVDTQNPTGYAQVVDELQNGAVTRTYSYGLERISETQTGGTSFYGYDGHGTVRQLTSSAGAVTDTYDYDAFGNLINQTGSTPNNYLFAGEQYDPALGLYYNRARYLNTTTGRFWSMDSYGGELQSPMSLHRYLYASANPINRADPSGYEDADIASFSISSAVNQALESITTLVTTAVRITVVRVLTVSAAVATSIFAKPGVQEELEEGGTQAIQAAQNAFFEYEGVVTEAEAESSSIWNSFAQLRQYLNQLYTRLPGANPPNIEYHHLVEQAEEEGSGFSARAINSMSNIVPTPSQVHQSISAFYSSAPEWLDGVTVREWMATQGWEVQWKAGLEIWKQAMTGAITWRPPAF